MPDKQPYDDNQITEATAVYGRILGSIYEPEIKRLELALRLIVEGRSLGLLDFKDHALSIALATLREGGGLTLAEHELTGDGQDSGREDTPDAAA